MGKKELDNREVRNVSYRMSAPADDSRTVEGYALLFDTASDGLDFVEQIDRNALDGVLERSDVFALLNHDQGRGILARSKNGEGTLELIVDNKGLLYRFEAPHTSLGDELLENLRRGEVDQSSFAFTVKSDKWEKLGGGSWRRTILEFDQLYDVSPVYNAAYSATSVYLRGRDEAAARELDDYYAKVEERFNI